MIIDMKNIFSNRGVFILLKVMMGFVFLWAFLDKAFGLGFATKQIDAWVYGGSPTTGFLTHAVTGPFASFYQSLAGNIFVDWLFMLGLLFIGVTLIFNKFVKWGSYAGIVMLLLMYTALLWPANNPFVDEHLIYAIILLYIATKSEK